MQGQELIKHLAEVDRELGDKLEEARRSAEDRIKGAEEESQRLLAEAEAQINQKQEASQTRIAAARSKLAEEARVRIATEQEGLRRQAEPNLGRVVEFILSKVMP
jgi:vacuolar-type H+-ATPase subunit H